MEDTPKQQPNNGLLISGFICIAVTVFLLVRFIDLYKEHDAIKMSQTLMYLTDPFKTGAPGLLKSKIEAVETEMTIFGILMTLFFAVSVFLFLRYYFGGNGAKNPSDNVSNEIH